jgi:hypothetical protein
LTRLGSVDARPSLLRFVPREHERMRDLVRVAAAVDSTIGETLATMPWVTLDL